MTGRLTSRLVVARDGEPDQIDVQRVITSDPTSTSRAGRDVVDGDE
jgi:hypothetical protein